MNTEFTSDYYAKIKYVDDGGRDTIPVSSILEFTENVKEAINDFQKDTIYSVLWYDKNNSLRELGIQISVIQFIQSFSELQEFKAKRGNFNKLNRSVIDRYYEEEEIEDTDDKSDNSPVQQKSQRNTLKNDEKKLKKQQLDSHKNAQKDILSKIENFVVKETLEYDDDETQFVPSPAVPTNGCPKSPKNSPVFDEHADMIKDLETQLQNANERNKQMEKLLEAKNAMIADMDKKIQELRGRNKKLMNSYEVLTERFESQRIMKERLETQNVILEEKLFESSDCANAYAAFAAEYAQRRTRAHPVPKRKSTHTTSPTPPAYSGIDDSKLSARVKEVTPKRQRMYSPSTTSKRITPENDLMHARKLRAAATPKSKSLDSKLSSPSDVLSHSPAIFSDDDNNSPKSKAVPASSAKRHLDFSPSPGNIESLHSDGRNKDDSGLEDSETASSVKSFQYQPKVHLSTREVQMLTKNILKTKSALDSECDDADEKERRMQKYFANFGEKETKTYKNGTEVNYIWLNKDLKLLYDDWATVKNSKDARKFVKNLLRLLHTDENECLRYYCKKVKELSQKETKVHLQKMTSYIVEEINTCIKKQKELMKTPRSEN